MWYYFPYIIFSIFQALYFYCVVSTLTFLVSEFLAHLKGHHGISKGHWQVVLITSLVWK